MRPCESVPDGAAASAAESVDCAEAVGAWAVSGRSLGRDRRRFRELPAGAPAGATTGATGSAGASPHAGASADSAGTAAGIACVACGSSEACGAAGAPEASFADAGLCRRELLLQLVVLLVETAQLDDDLVEEVVDFVLVVPIAELDMLEPLVHYVFWRKRHEANLFSTTMWHFDW